ncbi:hypothetical protein Vadar_015624 [Vaccinium darrowii]|uniref:Uncharacterized protein n=1 Tax=Vaccinium darrowii TaxID=229202 RepID=A0ACB7YM64_9ERIC|nr:hypothetical protein Vadar_015624 [Vaccinium darrowii]
MAKPSTLYHLTATILIFLIITQFSSARPLRAFNPSTELPENPALPGGALPEKDSSEQVFPCEMESNQNSATEFSSAPKARLGGRYGPLFLAMLPKGSVPPSGPSRRINDDNN